MFLLYFFDVKNLIADFFEVRCAADFNPQNSPAPPRDEHTSNPEPPSPGRPKGSDTPVFLRIHVYNISVLRHEARVLRASERGPTRNRRRIQNK